MNITYSFFITFFAGFSTLLGTIPIFIKFKNTKKIISISLILSSFSMIVISLLDLLPQSFKLFNLNYNIFLSVLLFLIFFVTGMILISLINKIIASDNNLYKVGIISMIGIIVHNIPEGILTFITSSVDVTMGLKLAMAITLHNIPEGISIGIPLYYSTGSKIKTILYVLISALSEVFGAFITYLFLYDYINDILIAILLSLVCGVMTYISLFELIPEIINKKSI